MKLRLAAIAAALILSATSVVLAASGSMTYKLSAQNGSGETGTITLTPINGGKGTDVMVVTKGGSGAQPIHVHEGTCAKLNPAPKWPLTTLSGGKSDTKLPITIKELTSGEYAINVHKSTSDLKTYVACGNLTAMTSGSKM